MIPSARLLAGVALAALPLAAGVFVPALSDLGLAANLAVALAAVLDLAITPAPAQLEVAREVSEVLSVGASNPVRLHLRNRCPRAIDLELFDEAPEPSRTDAMPLRVTLPPWKEASITYHLVPSRRGQNRFRAVHLRYRSRLRLWTRVERRPLELAVRIYPDIRAVRRFDLLARRNRLSEMGLKLWRLRGREGEFERLREYRREDELRHIDWKATAKHRRLISREFTVERNQNVAILLDCGRSMCNETDGVSHLDRALNASIVLSYIALGQGDNVSLLAFASSIERAVGPIRGKPGIGTLIRGTFDLEPRLEASDYGRAWEELVRRQKKRALVVLITHVMDEQHIESIARQLRAAAQPHLLLTVFLKDVALTELAHRVPRSELEAFQVGSAAEILAAQARRVAALREAGVLVQEALPAELSAGMVNEYLDLKARHLL